MAEETNTRHLVSIRINNKGEHEVIFKHRSQMFAICTAFRNQLWDRLSNNGLPAKITWKIKNHS